ncbi:ATPase [Aureococcus anophagefferens]|nr:ATPase [Aureococcus anophagefferens]
MRRSFADTEAPLALAPQSTFEPVEIALWGLTYDVDGTRLLDGVTARFDHGQSAAVRHALFYGALLRSPRRWSRAKKFAAASSALRSLGLAKVANAALSRVSGRRRRAGAALELLAGGPCCSWTSRRRASTRTRRSPCSRPSRTWRRRSGATSSPSSTSPPSRRCRRAGASSSWASRAASPSRGGPRSSGPTSRTTARPAPPARTRRISCWPGSPRTARDSGRAGADGDEPAPAPLPSKRGDGTARLCVPAYAASFVEQYKILLLRSLHCYVADPSQGPTSLALTAFSVAFLALQLFGAPPSVAKANGILFFALVLYQAATLPLVVVMPLERAATVREYRNGVFGSGAYWLARVTTAALSALVLAALSMAIFYPSLALPSSPEARPLAWFAASFLGLVVFMVVGLILGTVLPSALVSVKAVPALMVLMLLTSGFLPPRTLLRPGVAWLQVPNPLAYVLKLLFGAALTKTDKGRRVVFDADLFDVREADQARCFLALGAILVALVVLGFFATHARLAMADAPVSSLAPAAPAAPAALTSHPQLAKTLAFAKALEPQKTLETTTTPLLAGALPDDDEVYGALDDDVPPVSVVLRDVTCTRRNGAATLRRVSCAFHPGAATAVLGPSGAGKTTLLETLCGRVDGDVAGDVDVNGRPLDAERFKLLATLTPQADALIPELTPRQTLHYTARLRCGSCASRHERLQRAEDVLVALDLGSCADVAVGGRGRLGVSGGQRKRVSIGMDLLASRPVMILDEPTTGLDAEAACRVASLLRSLGFNGGRTVLCTIHQPQWAVLAAFPRTLALCDGRVAFEGPPASLAPFLRSAGRPVPEAENPADFFMVALATEGGDVWGDAWDRARRGLKTTPLARAGACEEKHSLPLLAPGYGASFWEQFTILFERSAYVFCVDQDQGLEFLVPPCLVAVLVGLVFYDAGVSIWAVSGVAMGVLGLSILTMLGVVLNIPLERDLVLREYKNGAYAAEAYWAARAALGVAAACLVAVAQTPIWWTLMGLPRRGLAYATLLSALTAAFYVTMGGLIGLLSPDPVAAAQRTEPVTASILMFAGVLVPKARIKPFLLFIYDAIPARYSIEAATCLALPRSDPAAADVPAYFDMHRGHLRRNLAILAAEALAILVVGGVVARWRLTLRS